MSAKVAKPLLPAHEVALGDNPSTGRIQTMFNAATGGLGQINARAAARLRAFLATDTDGRDLLNKDPESYT